jgi:hypothetical protein
MMPVRLQLSRAKGFKLQALSMAINGLAAVNVARPSRWGNPWKVGEQEVLGLTLDELNELSSEGGTTTVEVKTVTAAYAVQRYRELVHACGQGTIEAMRTQLRGKNLACWCKPGEPCHADVLLELSNG